MIRNLNSKFIKENLLDLSAAFLIVAIQVLTQNLMTLLIGQTANSEILITLAAFSGMLLGYSGLVSRKNRKILFLFSIVFQFVLFASYNQIINFGLSHSLSKFVFMFLAYASLVGAAIVFVERIYTPNFELKNYMKLSLFSALIAGVLLLHSLYFNKNILHLFAALSFLAFLISHVRYETVRVQLDFSRSIIQSMLIGAINGLFLSYVVTLIHTLIFPTGLEFYFYIFLIFFLSFIASFLFLKKQFFFSIETGQLISLGMSVAVLALLTITDNKENFLFDVVKLSVLLPFMSYYPYLVFLLILIFMMPYFLLSVSVPLLQSKSVELNHIFFTTLGAVLIQSATLIPSLYTNFNHLIYLQWLFVVVYLCVFSGSMKMKKVLLMFVMGLIGVAILKLPTLDDRLMGQARRFHVKFWLPQEILETSIGKKSNKFIPSDFLIRNGYKVGAFGGETEWLKLLTFNGYSAENYSPHDYIKATLSRLAQDKLKPKNILLMGLGNHIVLKSLVIDAKADAQIDVVDNSIFFKDLQFLNSVAKASGFHWPTENVNLISDDILRYFYNSDKKYDLIIWNLTLPNYADSLPLFSETFARKLREHLSDNGVYLVPYYNNLRFDCVNANLYAGVEVLRTVRPINLASFYTEATGSSKSKKEVFSKLCNGVEMVQFNSQFQERIFHNGSIARHTIKDDWRLRADDIEFKQAVQFNQSTILENKNSKTSLVVNLPFFELDVDDQSLFRNFVEGNEAFSISYLDHYNSSDELFKINQMLHRYTKPGVVVLNISLNPIPPALLDDVQTYFPKKQESVELLLDDSVFWNKQFKAKNEKELKVLILADNNFKLYFANRFKSYENLSIADSNDSANMILIGYENRKQFDELAAFLPRLTDKRIVVWHPPWVTRLQTNLSGKASYPVWNYEGSSFWKELTPALQKKSSNSTQSPNSITYSAH